VASRGIRSTHATIVTRYTLRANSNWDVTGNAFESLGTNTEIASCWIHLTQAAIVTSEVFGASFNRDVAGNACEPFRALANILPNIIHSAGATIVALCVRIGANPYGHLTGCSCKTIRADTFAIDTETIMLTSAACRLVSESCWRKHRGLSVRQGGRQEEAKCDNGPHYDWRGQQSGRTKLFLLLHRCDRLRNAITVFES
jgi:hypothetical protein